jgi:hypothetical protein
VHATFKALILTAILLATPLNTSNLRAQILPQEERPRRENEEWLTKQQREQARQRNFERQKKLKQDTDRLLELATELKQYVDRTNENTLSVDVVKKCEEIEKLAKDVKNKMKGT